MGTLTYAVAQAAPNNSSPGSTNNVLLLVLTSSVLAGLLTHILTGLRAGAEARRNRYADAVKLLVARIEYPYRIRRRTSDGPETLAALTAIGHDLQERLAEKRAWISAENRLLGEVFDDCLAQIDGPVRQACNEAWNSQPITSAANMNMNGFGPGGQQDTIARMNRAITYRFGWRRVLPDWAVRKLL